jgi:hypothetical protein
MLKAPTRSASAVRMAGAVRTWRPWRGNARLGFGRGHGA